MIVPVVVSTGPGRGGWLGDCLGSISRGNLTVCLSRTGGELGALRMIYEGTHWTRWLMLQDSTVVTDQALFDVVDQVSGPALVAPRPCMYMALFERSVLDRLSIPDVPAGVDRELAIRHECQFMDAYVSACAAAGFRVPVIDPTLADGYAAGTEMRHGRLNLVLRGRYLTKYKGTWR